MSITSRINEIETHLKEDYTNLEALGYDIPQDKNIENIASVLDNVWENQSHIEETGTTLSLNTNKGKAKVDLLGNTYQETTTGKNKYDFTKTSSTTHGITLVSNSYQITFDGTNDGSAGTFVLGSITLPAGTYTYQQSYISGSITSGLYRIWFIANDTDLGNIGVGSGYTDNKYKTFTLNESSTFRVEVFFAGNNPIISNNYKINVNIISGETPDYEYERYTNGASPNPSYPQPIQVVSGDNEVKVEGKNLFTTTNYYTSDSGVSVDIINSNSVAITYDGSSSTYKRAKFKFLNLRKNTNYSFKATITNSNSSITSNYLQIRNVETSTTIKGQIYTSGEIVTFNTSDFDTLDIALYTIGASATTNNTATYSNIQLELGDSVGDFEPYQSQTYPINLGDIELCKIGDYQDKFFKAINGNTIYDNLDRTIKDTLDYGDWYLEKNIGKVVLDGTQENGRNGQTETYNQFKTTIVGKAYGETNFICNKFHLTGSTLYSIRGRAANESVFYNLAPTDCEYTLEGIATWLSNNKPIIYYQLATPTYTKIEGTLASQLEDVWRANTYDNQTNVSQVNNDLPFELYFKALGTPSNTLLGLSRQLNQIEEQPLNEIEEEPIEEIEEESGE